MISGPVDVEVLQEALSLNSRLHDLALVPLRLHRLVVGLLATCLAFVNVLVLPLETATVLLLGADLLQNGLLAVLLVETTAIELSRALDDGADLREGRNVVVRVILLIMALGVQDVPHFQQLEIAT